MSDYSWTEKHYRVESIWESLRGKTVEITWRESGHFKGLWTRYRVELADSEWVRLHGVHEPDEITGGTSEYIGGPIVVRLADIEMAEVID